MNSFNNSQSEYIWFLQLRNKGLQNRIASFESGSAYVNLRNELKTTINEQRKKIKEPEHELATARSQIVQNRERWFEVTEDIQKEHEKEIKKKDRRIAELESKLLDTQRQRDAALDKCKEIRAGYYAVATELEEEKGKNKKLTAQVNKDFENSSIPSSGQRYGHKKIPNTREKSGRKSGGQPGHEGHRLQQMQPNITVHLPDPDEYVNDPEYYPTKEVIKRQKIILNVGVTVKEYTATVFRSRKNGSRVYAAFPDGYETDISYDSSVKGLAFILSVFGNMSAEKICETLREISHGKIKMSKATVLGLCREVSEKSEPEKQEIVNDLMTSPVVNADFTNSNVNGNGKQVLLLASPAKNAVMYIARASKGHKGIQGTLLEDFVGTVVHDHDKTFYNYGLQHQECMQHNIRYLIGSEQNEPELKWNKQMHKLLQEMIHYRNDLGEDDLDPETVKDFENRYDEILRLAKEEYEYDPPSDYYKEGYNLYRRLEKYKDSELLFLHDKRVPANNSLVERLARIFKRKQNQMMVIRSEDNAEYLCDCLSVVNTFRYQGGSNLYDKICEILSRKKERKPRYMPSL